MAPNIPGGGGQWEENGVCDFQHCLEQRGRHDEENDWHGAETLRQLHLNEAGL